MSHIDLFKQYRNLLFHVAYRMVSTVMDAEDLVQDAYLKWQQVDLSTVENPKGYLTTLVTRLCIDHLRSARVQRETYIGPWLPAPLVTEGGGRLELRETLSIAFLRLLEALTPSQRAAFLLRDVFDYEYAEIADILETSPTNCRQMVSRARKHVSNERSRYEASPEQQQALVEQFMATLMTGDVDGMVERLAQDVVLYSDGGGVVRAATRPVHGPQAAAALILGLRRFITPSMTVELGQVNGMPAVLVYEAGKPFSVTAFDLNPTGEIQAVFNILNPAKLAHL